MKLTRFRFSLTILYVCPAWLYMTFKPGTTKTSPVNFHDEILSSKHLANGIYQLTVFGSINSLRNTLTLHLVKTTFTLKTLFPAPAAIRNTIDECRSKIVRNRVFDCHLSPRATNGNRKHCLKRFLIRVRRSLRAFFIATYPVCYLSWTSPFLKT